MPQRLSQRMCMRIPVGAPAHRRSPPPSPPPQPRACIHSLASPCHTLHLPPTLCPLPRRAHARLATPRHATPRKTHSAKANGVEFESTKARNKPIVFLFGSRPFTGGMCPGTEEVRRTHDVMVAPRGGAGRGERGRWVGGGGAATEGVRPAAVLSCRPGMLYCAIMCNRPSPSPPPKQPSQRHTCTCAARTEAPCRAMRLAVLPRGRAYRSLPR